MFIVNGPRIIKIAHNVPKNGLCLWALRGNLRAICVPNFTDHDSYIFIQSTKFSYNSSTRVHTLVSTRGTCTL